MVSEAVIGVSVSNIRPTIEVDPGYAVSFLASIISIKALV